MATTVVNKRTHKPTANDVYVGRPSAFGNPFRLTQERYRGECINAYTDWIMQPAQEALRVRMKRELRDKTLVCWCAPRKCHADIIAWIVDGEPE
jgi:hypothetical protein